MGSVVYIFSFFSSILGTWSILIRLEFSTVYCYKLGKYMTAILQLIKWTQKLALSMMATSVISPCFNYFRDFLLFLFILLGFFAWEKRYHIVFSIGKMTYMYIGYKISKKNPWYLKLNLICLLMEEMQCNWKVSLIYRFPFTPH